MLQRQSKLLLVYHGMRWRRQAWPSLNKVPIVRAAMRLQAHGVED
jgi:hypothetical protein